ncbi:MAG: hypothetical protein Q9187_001195 [Circinaria calcarea]
MSGLMIMMMTDEYDVGENKYKNRYRIIDMNDATTSSESPARGVLSNRVMGSSGAGMANTNDDTSTTTSATAIADKTPDKKSKMDKLREKANKAQTNAIISQAERLSLFDSTKASEWETTGTASQRAMNVVEGGYMVSGRNIGAEQKEPKWDTKQLQAIRTLSMTKLNIMPVTDTRRSVMDPEMEFVGKDQNGSIVPTEKAYVSSLDPSQYCIGTGPEKYDVTGSPRYYSDVVVADINGQWLINQWTSEMVVIEGVAQNVLMQTNRTGNQSGRRIGYHFARVGLPKMAFGPLFYTMSTQFPGVMAQIAETEGYYWTNASWGVSSFQGTFAYMSENGIQRTTNLVDVMRMLNGKSSLALATLAISITCPAKMVDGKPVADRSAFGLSIKLHNAFGYEVVDYHGPPQQGSTGMMVPSRIAGMAKMMNGSSVMKSTMGGGSSIFASANKGLFGTAGAGASSIKSDDNISYM